MSEKLNETPFRVYTLDALNNPVCLGAADDVSLGDCLLSAVRRGFTVRGILYRPVRGKPGEWLVSPWA